MNPFTLPTSSVITLNGPDAAAFAQSQFANDVTTLLPGQWQWSAWLNAKGRVIALLALIKHDENRIDLLLQDNTASTIAEQLRRYVFRCKVAVVVQERLQISGIFQAPDKARQAIIAHTADGRIELDFSNCRQPRTLCIGPPSGAIGSQQDSVNRWYTTDLQSGLPHLSSDAQQNRWTPQQLSLDRLHAFSTKKGCYPGQEVVARTHFLGKTKRELVLLQLSTAVAADTPVFQNGRPIGEIICATGGIPATALAVLTLDRGEAPLFVADAQAQPLPLIPGLER
ncbi:MAG: folate-binding protein [Xanthomonadaceae bacterium]|jgi:folate-binding protein YgfZ|nr:folate-binding protein [Xanthomonadaceae bacterium]